VADDNTNIQKMVALAFEERGIDVVSVGNGEAAVRRIPDLSPDLVLADVFMPVRNGYEVCEFVKKHERFAHVPVILLVGAFDPLDEKEARRVGADGVLKKPFVPPDPLIAMVTSALEKNPRIAAELAKAREAPAAPAPEPPSPLLEAPARMEPKPLPEFPEPTPEEAAVIYGFGKGRGRLDDEETEEAPPPKDTASTEVDDSEDDFDGSSTTRDWRRNAGNFEVPDEVGSKFAFAPEGFNPVSFPSETELPPRHLPMTDAEEISETAGPNSLPGQASPEAVAPLVPEIPEMVAFGAEQETAKENASPGRQEGETPSEPPQPEKSKLKSWMDAIASPSEYGDAGWMSAIFGGRSKDKSAKKEDAHSAPESTSESGTSPRPHAAQESAREAPRNAESEPPFTVETPAVAEPWLAPPPPSPMGTLSEPIATPELADDLVAAPAELAGSLRHPELELSPPPRVSPEPLPVPDEEPRDAFPFSGAAQRSEPLPSFLPPASAEPLEEIAHEEPAIPEAFDTPILAPDESASVMNHGDERIPTAPPPNREALSHIPFLTPPPPEPAESDAPHSPDAPSVDAIVTKVLEKLEPQLHDLLSQGLLKPLVENLLQQELAKKGK
jgi:CheY-like chemotaxis protein